MKFLHTGDWHIGKIVNGYSMLEDQKYYLNRLIDELQTMNLDAVLMTGDLYDRSVPPKEAVALANELINRIVKELDLPLFIIAGNHDSNERLEFGSDLLAQSNLYIEGVQKEEVRRVDVGEASIYLVPFSDYIQTRKIVGEDSIHSFQDALNYQVDEIKDKWDASRINILMYHGYIVNGSSESIDESDSERQLSIGNVEYVDVASVEDFDYVALGHLHKAQKVKNDRVRYSGSPLKYSKSEHNHKKQSLIVHLDKDKIDIEPIIIEPLRDLKVVEDSFDNVMESSSDDYVFFQLTDKDYVYDAMNRLKLKYPNAMALDYEYEREIEEESNAVDLDQIKKLDTIDLFEDFYERFKGVELSDDKREIVVDVLKEVKEGIDR